MKKGFAVLIALAMLVLMMAGCTEKKTFEIGKDPQSSTASQESSNEESSEAAPADSSEASQTEEASDEAAEESAEEPAQEAVEKQSYHWEDMTFELTEINEDVSQWNSTQLKDPEGKWVVVILTITEGKMESGHLNDLLMNEGLVSLDGKIAGTIMQQGVEIVENDVYAVGTIDLLFDMPADYTPDLADVVIQAEVPEGAAEPATAEEEAAGQAEVGTVDGIEVVSGEMARPGTGEMAYRPSGDTGYFAVDGRLVAQTTIGIAVDPPGVLNYDLTLKTDGAKTIDGKIEVYKDGTLLATYTEANVELPEGDTVINACVNTGEEEVCSGDYKVLFYINNTLVIESEGTIS